MLISMKTICLLILESLIFWEFVKVNTAILLSSGDLYRGEIRDIIVGGLSLYTASVRNNKEFNPTSSLEDAIGRGSCVTKRWSDMSRVILFLKEYYLKHACMYLAWHSNIFKIK